jgi:hypothetical protein
MDFLVEQPAVVKLIPEVAGVAAQVWELEELAVRE